MDSYWGPPRSFWYGGPRRPNAPDPDLRVSDAERTRMSETLSKHYADGRLDDSEFKERLDKAMAAKTRGDLGGLLYDLPPLEPEHRERRSPGIARRLWWAFTVAAFVVVALAALSALAPTHFPWWLLLIVLFVVFRPGRFHHHHHHRTTDA
jgi:Domain of unknown function (DUF1707)